MTKRFGALLVPYFLEDGELFVYLQKRGPDMERLPNYFGFFGGGIENGETPEQGLFREIQEELGIDLTGQSIELFNTYEFLSAKQVVYTFKVERNWEDQVIIGEGEYGKWFTITEALQKPDMILADKVILNSLEIVYNGAELK